ncbi:Serine/threonine-protein kinase PrkC [Enhygromyxa salina]|uniref:Serine/threonine-protein kinase PrkC n=1 Tax=Enhygromyxa salina TaxID=215803 RepID=A0A2S9YE69_9BACT|nr:serine/threonine-protein kinase [Enhygromyxa salina]PRQ03414.1 Serine/threonine-protein kinase PrkC [Enhygromyxa salina]
MVDARTAHQAHPDNPLVKIGRFDGWKLIGQGGYGAVFEVIDPELDRHVALKLCLTRGPKAAEAITREAKVMAKLSHPNIITVHETGKLGEDVFFVMELVEGANGKFENTGNHLIYKRPHWRDAVNVYRQVGRGLAAAHEAGVVHGDFKPGNVLTDSTGRPRVVDFGLAQVMRSYEPDEAGEGLEHRMGTLPYMAPEVLRGEPGDVRADQWSFCVALWETVEGVLPYLGATTLALLESITDDEPFSPRSAAEVPAKLRAILRKGLSADPRERYPSMAALVDALDELIEEPPGEGKPPERELPPAGRPRGGILFFLAMGAAFCLMLGALGHALLFVGSGSTPTPTPTPAAAPVSEPGSPCALPASARPSTDLDDDVLATCVLIRAGHFEQANDLWERQRTAREPRLWNDGLVHTPTDLGSDTLVVAQTFLDQAEALGRTNPSEARIAAAEAYLWATLVISDVEEGELAADAAAVIKHADLYQPFGGAGG